jgi:phosphatidate cytidylyltransferase
LRDRVTSGITLVFFLAAVVVFNNTFRPALNIAIALVSVLGVYEIISALGFTRNLMLMIPSLIFACVFPFCDTLVLREVAYFLYNVVIFSGLIFYHTDVTFREVGVIYSMALMIPTALSTIINLRDFGQDHGMFYVIIAISSAWISDVGGFFAGRLFGKHKLCPNISPKKTIEGVVGSFFLNIFAMLLFGLIFEKVFPANSGVNYLPLLIIGVFGTVLSILGDLSFSLIKRSCHIKDFGEIIPGHGGILDRFDSVIFEAPFVFLLVQFLPIVV